MELQIDWKKSCRFEWSYKRF